MNIVAAQGDTEIFFHCTRVFEKMVLRRIFGPEKDEINEGWEKIHNQELHNFR
jgi:hypothetical protein